MSYLRIVGKPGPAGAVDRILRDGETIVIGRGRSADVLINDDALMSGTHFQIKHTGRHFVLSDLGSMNGTFVNREKVTEIRLLADDIIKAGHSEFEVSYVDQISLDVVEQEQDEAGTGSVQYPAGYYPTPVDLTAVKQSLQATIQTEGFLESTAAEVIQRFQLASKFPQEIALDFDCSPEEFVKELQQNSLQKEALEFLAFALPKRCAVWWACLCTREANHQLTETQKELLTTAEEWVKSPNENIRYQAMDLANKTDFSHSTSWICSGAFYTEGSMTPRGAAAVSTLDELTGKSIAGAVLISATENAQRTVPQWHGQFINLGLSVAEGKLKWEQPA